MPNIHNQVAIPHTNMAQTTRVADSNSKNMFSILRSHNEDYELVPAPIDISQEECSQIESDLKKYLETGRRLDDYQNDYQYQTNLETQMNFDQFNNSGYYAQEDNYEGNWIKGKLIVSNIPI